MVDFVNQASTPSGLHVLELFMYGLGAFGESVMSVSGFIGLLGRFSADEVRQKLAEIRIFILSEGAEESLAAAQGSPQEDEVSLLCLRLFRTHE